MEVGGRLASCSQTTSSDEVRCNTKEVDLQDSKTKLQVKITHPDYVNLKDIFDLPCPSHSNAKSEFYCENHNSTCCGTCVMILHKDCGKVVHLPEKAENVNAAYRETRLFLGDISNLIGKRKQTLEILSKENAAKLADGEKDVKGLRQTINSRLESKTTEQLASIGERYLSNWQYNETVLQKNTNLKMQIEAELNDIEYFTSKQQPARAYLKSIKVDDLKAKASEVDKMQTECKTSLMFAFKPEYSVNSALEKATGLGNICSIRPSRISSGYSTKGCCLNILRNYGGFIKIISIIFLLVFLQQLMLSAPKDQERFLKPVYMPVERFIQSTISCIQWFVFSVCITVVSEMYSGVVWTISSVCSGFIWLMHGIYSVVVCTFHIIYYGFVLLMHGIYSCIFWPFYVIFSEFVRLMQGIYSVIVWIVNIVIFLLLSVLFFIFFAISKILTNTR